MFGFGRKKKDGDIVPPKEHRCKPPKSYEWPPGEWKLDKDLPVGSEWTCDCGQLWRVGTKTSLGLWKNWEEVY